MSNRFQQQATANRTFSTGSYIDFDDGLKKSRKKGQTFISRVASFDTASVTRIILNTGSAMVIQLNLTEQMANGQ